MTAFSNAILDQVTQLDHEVHYELLCNGTVTDCLARDYLSVRPEEVEMIAQCLDDKSVAPSILDLGACVGRHSLCARFLRPESQITIVERDAELRQHCLDTFQPQAAYANFLDIDNGRDFDVMFMLGLGLGIFGDEHQTRLGLMSMVGRLKRGGSLLIEGGKSTPGEFTTQNYSIRYVQDQDEPFNWGYATFDWLKNTINDIGQLELSSRCVTSNGDNYFICQINKRA